MVNESWIEDDSGQRNTMMEDDFDWRVSGLGAATRRAPPRRRLTYPPQHVQALVACDDPNIIDHPRPDSTLRIVGVTETPNPEDRRQLPCQTQRSS